MYTWLKIFKKLTISAHNVLFENVNKRLKIHQLTAIFVLRATLTRALMKISSVA